ncbi:MAG: GNAT family N-acetyltransferase [Planctomycetota bacterium]
MPEQPSITTARLVLRPLTLNDAADVQRLAGDFDIASTALLIPHPYEDGLAERWLRSLPEQWERGEAATFAITFRKGGELLGAIGLTVCKTHARAELGYWIGKPYWGQGYCTEAAAALVDFGFTHLTLNRVFAHHFVRNPASGRVLQKIGMRHEGCLKNHVLKWNVFEDIEVYGIVRGQWQAARAT